MPTFKSKYTHIDVIPTSDAVEFVTEYLVCSNFNINIPFNAQITGTTITIKRRSHVSPTTYRYIKDSWVSFVDNVDLVPSVTHNHTTNSAITSDNWGTEYTGVTYGYVDDLWEWDPTSPGGGETIWNSSLVNSSKFGVLIKCSVKNLVISPPLIPIPDIMGAIECVTVTIRYFHDKKWETFRDSIYFDENIKFDDTLQKFGVMGELINSKVNIDGDKILKFDDAKYPIVDQFGYSYNSRFIFKSDWDKDFYIKTTGKFIKG